MMIELPHLDFEQIVALRCVIADPDGQWLVGRDSDSHGLLSDWQRHGWFAERESSIQSCVLYEITDQGRIVLGGAYFETGAIN